MASYTIEDIELIRRKSGISYQEAVALLDYHNGDVTRALIDLERNGKLKSEQTAPRANSGTEGRSILRNRIVVTNGGETIVNLPLIFMLGVLLFSPWVVIISLILCLVQGYQINIHAQDEKNGEERFERMVRSAASSVKQTVSGIAREINQSAARESAAKQSDRASAKEFEKAPAPEQPAEEEEIRETPEEIVRELEEEMGKHSAPVLQVPVRVESQDGSVRYEQDRDGYGMATVE